MRPLIVRVASDRETVIAKVLAERGITAGALAKASGLAKSTILSVMHGVHTPRLSTAEKITEAIHGLSPRVPSLTDLFVSTVETHGHTEQAIS